MTMIIMLMQLIITSMTTMIIIVHRGTPRRSRSAPHAASREEIFYTQPPPGSDSETANVSRIETEASICCWLLLVASPASAFYCPLIEHLNKTCMGGFYFVCNHSKQ